MTFNNLGIAPKLLEILHRLKFTTPTPIQEQSIPTAIEGKDLMGIAQTGTGKTLAFGIPMIQRLAQNQGAKGLVILPTRELALQVDESLHKIGKPLGLKTAVLIGGEPINRQFRSLKTNPHIVIATPGRLIDHLQQKTISLDKVMILVLDEADHMLDMGFAPQIKQILKSVPARRQTLLFSATMPPEIVEIATSYMALPVRVEVSPPGTTAKAITQELFFVAKQDKPRLLEKLLTENNGSILVFTRTKFGAKKVAHSLNRSGITAAEIHSNRSQNQRQEALKGFKIGKYRVLVATDIAARGIDVSGIELVINYDLPEKAEDYVHRIGRTARAGKAGRAVSFATPDQRADVSKIERLTKVKLPVGSHGELPPAKAQPFVEREESPRRFSRPARPQGQHRARGFGDRPEHRPFGSHGSGGSRSGGRGKSPREKFGKRSPKSFYGKLPQDGKFNR